MSDALKLCRQELLKIKPFDSSRVGLETGILLDANESPWDDCRFNEVALNRYIDDMFDPAILTALSAFYEVSPSHILLTRGSCEGIDLLVRAFCRSYQDAILVSPPTFSIFALCAMTQGAEVINVPLQRDQDFALDATALLNSVTDNTKLVFICTPNNPTGNLVPVDDIMMIVKALQGKAMVVVDEAYIEFADGKSVASLVDEFSNLVVLRTLSKAFGLAGLRTGVLIAQTPLIKILTAMMMPFPFSVLTIQALKQALTTMRLTEMNQQIAYIHQQRAIFKTALQDSKLVQKVWDSEGNFLFVQFHDAKPILEACHQNGILVRHFIGVKEYENYLRISVGLDAQNQAFLKMLETFSIKTPAFA